MTRPYHAALLRGQLPRIDDVDTLASILALDGALVTAWDAGDVAVVESCIERLRVQLTAWHAARDGDKDSRKLLRRPGRFWAVTP